MGPDDTAPVGGCVSTNLCVVAVLDLQQVGKFNYVQAISMSISSQIWGFVVRIRSGNHETNVQSHHNVNVTQ